MLRFVPTLLVIALFAAAAAAQTGPAGDWSGAISIPGSPLRVEVTLVDNADWSGTISIPAQSLRDFALADVEVDPPTVGFRMPGIPGDPTFSGTISDDGSRIEGTFTQGGQTLPFRLDRADAAREEAAERARLALEGLPEFVRVAMDSLSVPGAAVAIVRGEDVLFMEGFGYRNVAERQPVTTNTLFAIGSSTKALTAATLGTLVDEGLLAWDAPVVDYLPAFRLADPFASGEMNAVDLLTHRSGLPRHDLLWYASGLDRRELFNRLRHLPPTESFRTRWQYQNLMYLAAGVLTEELTGQTWEEAVRQRLLEPLGMTAANFSVVESQRQPDHALPYAGGRDSVTVGSFRTIDPIGPAGSINASIADMARWAAFQLGDGTVDGREVLSASTLSFLHAPQIIVSGQRPQAETPYLMYALGWFVEPLRGRRMLQHGGNIDGFSALVGFLPDDDLAVVVLTNKNGSALPRAAMMTAFDRLLELDSPDRLAEVLSAAAPPGQQNRAPERVEGTSPAHPLAAYAGTYEHPGYGPFTITAEDDRLRAAYFTIEGLLEHVHFDTFELNLQDRDARFRLTFSTDAHGRVHRLAVPIEMTADPILFDRQPDDELRQPAYLAAFEGVYRGAGLTFTVSRRGPETLMLAVSGQGSWPLVPTRADAFDLDGLSGFSVRFEREGEDVVRLIVIQPNLTFAAERAE
jgi:CubicO group peptidase (beta-lactamase class C family)